MMEAESFASRRRTLFSVAERYRTSSVQSSVFTDSRLDRHHFRDFRTSRSLHTRVH